MKAHLQSWINALKLIEEPYLLIGNNLIDFNESFKQLLSDKDMARLNDNNFEISYENDNLIAEIHLNDLIISGVVLTQQSDFTAIRINSSKPKHLGLSEFIVTNNGEIKKVLNDPYNLFEKLNISAGSSLENSILSSDLSLVMASIRQAYIDQINIEHNINLYSADACLESYNLMFCFEKQLAAKEELLVKIEKPTVAEPTAEHVKESEYLWENALFRVSDSVKGLEDKFVSSHSLQSLNDVFKADYTFLAKYDPVSKKARTIFVASENGILENFEYELAKTPCELVNSRGVCVYNQHVQQIFPEDHLLEEMGIESYAGVPIKVKANNNNTDYILVSLFKTKLEEAQSSFIKKMLLIFSIFYELEIEKSKHFEYGLKLAEERQHILEGLKEYAFLTSHELRAPLTNLLGLTQSANFDFNNDNELKEYISYIRESCIKLDETTRKMNKIVTNSYYKQK
ncbi:MAG: hypothetical protein JXQ87_05410 [Bacteroidia bacterium]